MHASQETNSTHDQTSDNATYTISSKCSGGSCVGVARLADGTIKVRNTAGDSTPLTFTREEWVAFIAGVKDNEFDI